MFPNRVPMYRDNPSPKPLAKQVDSIYSLINVCVLESPKRSPPTYIQEEHEVTIHRAPHRWKSYTQWGVAWFLKGTEQVKSINTLI